MFVREAMTDSIMDLRAAPSDLSIPAHTAFIMRKNEQTRNGRVYSIDRPRASSPLQNTIMGSARNHIAAAAAMETAKTTRTEPATMFSAESLSPLPIYLATAAETPTPMPVPMQAIIPYIGWEMEMADMASASRPEHQTPSMKVWRFSTMSASNRGRDIVSSARLGLLRRFSTSLALLSIT